MAKFKILFIVFTIIKVSTFAQDIDSNENAYNTKNQNIKESYSSTGYVLAIDSLFFQKRVQEEKRAYHQWLNTLCKIGDVYLQWGIYEKAIEYYQIAKDTFPTINQDTDLHLNLLQSLAIAHKKLFQNKKAISNYEEMLNNVYKAIIKDQKLNVLNELLELYNKENEHVKALVVGNQLISIFLDKKDSLGVTRTFNYLGTIFKKIDNIEAARSHFEKALSYYPHNNNSSDGKSVILLNLGIVNQSKGDYKQALKCFQEALSLQIKDSNREETARIHTYLSANYLAAAAYDLSISHAQKAIDLSKEKQYLPILQVAYELLWQCFEFQQELESALQAFKEYVLIKEKIHVQKIQEQSLLDRKLKEAEKLETRIITLLSENELKVTALNREKLERRNKEVELYLLKKELELTNFQSYQKALLQDKEIERLVLLEQTLSSQSREKQLAFQIQKKQLENNEKQRRIDGYNQKNRINQLQLLQKELKIKNQRWLQIVMLMTFLILVIIVYFIFNHHLRKEKTQKQLLHFQNIEIEQRLLRSQMNPHFVFNALNSIQYYITSHDNASAARYLSKFSQVMRNILESSRHQYVLLKDELKLLQLYLELEQLRFYGQFKFQIIVDKSIDVDEISIPPMIIQPYVENAILHGVMMLKHQGQISINYQIEQDYMECTIIDNGIGREAAAKIRKTNNPKHQSVATSLTKHRLDLLNKTQKKIYEVIITDLYNQDHNPNGTKVTVRFPYISI